jgi:hypothetical protein
MVSVEELKEQELESLNESVEVGEYGLEELILLGEDRKIPITIEYPRTDGTKVKAKALIKQLTIKEVEEIKFTNMNSIAILQRALFKSDGSNFKRSELGALPIGVVNAISEKILEVSGVTTDNELIKQAMDF